METIIDAINNVQDFFNGGFFAWLDTIFTQLVTYLIIAKLKSQIFFMEIAWGIAQTLLANLNLSSLIQSSWSGVDSTLMSYLNFFRLPEALNIILQGGLTSFVLRLIGK